MPLRLHIFISLLLCQSVLLSAGDFAGRYTAPGVINDTVISLDIPPVDCRGQLTVLTRAAILKPGAEWSLRLIMENDTLAVTFSALKASPHDVFDSDKATLSITSSHNGTLSAFTSPALSALTKAYNSVALTLDGDSLLIMGGHRKLQYIGSARIENGPIPCKMEISSSETSDISELSLNFVAGEEEITFTLHDDESLSRLPDSPEASGPEGYWEYLDRNTSPRKAREGGRYRLAIVRSLDRPGTFDIIYLSGATVNGSKWKRGMRKGRLIPTDFESHYDLEWIDATFNLRILDMYADIDQESILTLRFPLLDSSIRFSRSTAGIK